MPGPAAAPVLFGAFLIAGVHIVREMHLGNVNLLMLFLCVAGLDLLLKRRDVFPGILLGCAILFKPHFLILLPLLVILKRWKALLSFGATVAAGLLWPALFTGWERNLSLLRDWLAAMGGHNSSAEMLRAPNTLQHWVGLFLPSPRAVTAAALLLLLLVYAAILFLLRRDKERGSGETAMLSFFILTALIPNLTVTDTEHFLFSIPLVFYLLASFKGLPWPAALLVSLGFLLYGFNWPDLWGRHLSNAFARTGLLGIGNLAIVASSLLLLASGQRRTK
jgi:hypothetical protein